MPKIIFELLYKTGGIFGAFNQWLVCSYMIRSHKNIKIFFNYFLGPLLGAWLFYSLYKQVKDQPHLQESIDLIKHAPFGVNAWKFWLVFALVFLNWGIEARKWQLLVKNLQSIKFFTAYKAVLSGLTLSLNTPNRMGEYGGRILYIKEGNRLSAISLSIAGSISQLIITLIMGCGGVLFIIYHKQSQNPVTGLSVFWLKIFSLQILLGVSAVATVLLLLFFFRLSWITRFLESIPRLSRFTRYMAVVDHFTAKVLLRLLSLSFFRYLVFVLQYILLLQVLNVNLLWMEAFWLISILFLVLAIVPSFAIADLGIRGKFSVELLSLYSANTIGIIGATFGIWFINLFVPAILGSLLILGSRIFKDR